MVGAQARQGGELEVEAARRRARPASTASTAAQLLPASPHPCLPALYSQVWQWVRYGATLDGGKVCTPELVRQVIEEECEAIRAEVGGAAG